MTTIDTKNAARDAARAAFLPVIDHIRHHREIETSAKEELGMKARPRRRAPIEPPDTVPVLSLVALGDGSHTLRYADERTPPIRR
ncbi:MAG: hypothetical protein EA377_12765 [Phycisphaerales bacterium]|nr:MAG: hypothetical protein EA377_12765 [Phycisphaerales bacterium]